jgi:hypothetical protein
LLDGIDREFRIPRQRVVGNVQPTSHKVFYNFARALEITEN